jgi:hypothetical protein
MAARKKKGRKVSKKERAATLKRYHANQRELLKHAKAHGWI